MITILIATLLAILAGVAVWWLDQRCLHCGTVFRATIATVLTAVAIWSAAVIYGMFWLEDYAVTALMWTRFPILFGCGLVILTFGATVASLFLPAKHNRWYQLIVPTVALTVFAWTYYCFSSVMDAFSSIMQNYTD